MRWSLIVAAAMLSSSLAGHADAIYTYSGPNYSGAMGAFNTSESVSGSFTLAAPLAPNLTNYTIFAITPYVTVVPDVLLFSFNDGVQTISFNANGPDTGLAASFNLGTDANGNITTYNIVINGSSSQGGGEINLQSPGAATTTGPIGMGGTAIAESGSFTTTITTSVTPEPSSLILLGTGLLGAAGVSRRRFR